MKRIYCWLAICLFASLTAQHCLGQSTVALGTPVFGSFAGGPDVVNIGDLNVHWNFPIVNKAGRGLPFVYNIPYDSTFWAPVVSGSTTSWSGVNTTSAFGWPVLAADSLGLPGSINYTTAVNVYNMPCIQEPDPPYINVTVTTYSNWTYTDGSNTVHILPGYTQNVSPSCPNWGASRPSFSGTSSEGFTVNISNYTTASITSKAGVIVTPGYGASCGLGTASTVDANGNEITEQCGVYTDTLGQTALTITGSTSSPPVEFTQANPTGTSTYTLNYSSYTVRTHFGCSGIAEFGPTTEELPSSLELADGRSYSFTYEATPGYSGDVTGRLASVTLPTGGEISYAYSGGSNGIECSDGSVPTLARTTPDGTTTYARTVSSSSEYVTISPPSYSGTVNQTVVAFNGTSAGYYEVSRQVYSGSASSGTILETSLTCYQYYLSSCATSAGTDGTTAIAANGFYASPNFILWHTTQWPNQTGISSGTEDVYDAILNNTSHVVFDYGSSGTGLASTTALQTTNTTYANNGSGTETGSPSEVKVLDSGGSTMSDTKYTYNGSSLVTTSGTPQHSTPTTGQMNLTQVQQWVSGTTYLTSSNTYYDTGNVDVATDVNGNTSTYTYGSSSCGNSFPTSVSTPTGGTVVTSLGTSATWNCVGGVQLTAVDVNGNTTTYSYGSDPFWRPTSVTSPTGAVTNYTYQTSSSNTSSSAMNFNGSTPASTNTVVITYDTSGRPVLQQTKQSPTSSNYDTVAITYDALGRAAFQSLAYSGTLGQLPSGDPGTTIVYDPLGRTSSVTDGGGGTNSYTYAENDVLVTVGPQVTSPATENLKKRNLQYNGAGWLTSVCEVVASTLPAGGACGQTTAYTGYLTNYTYDGAGRLKTVSQNAQPGSTGAQSRSLSYDGLSRKISETIPEWSAGTATAGTSSYTYDTESSSCNTTSKGDLIKSVDNMGNVTCMTYDLLHRPLSSKVVSGTYATVTPYIYAVYDAATTPSGGAAQNVKGVVAEAYTCNSPCSTKLTDIFSSASPVTTGATSGGVLQQMWESTPNSGGHYFETQDTYFPNGAVGAITATFNGSSMGIPNLTFQVEGEGRPYSATESAHNLVTAASYNPASLATSITFGNSATGSGNDSDSFTFDPNTYRPTVITNNIYPTGTSYSVTSNLTWNANGSLQEFQYTDGSPSPLSQTCYYKADDLSRIASVNCGTSTWDQTFVYDPFGNINKTNVGGATSYSAAYSTVTNQVSSGISPAPTYDANGNQKNLTAIGATIAWNAANQLITINGTTATYDAAGRMVETGSGSTWKQYVFRPSGAMLAVYSSGLVKGIVPLPGGDSAVYNSSGLNYIRHTDWLGSSRFATTWAHVVYSKESYAPFGETYNEAGTADRSFTGQDQDVVTGSGGTGTYDYLFRKYDPSAGRWLSPDPLGWGSVNLADPQSFDRYAYVENQPLDSTDPEGLILCYVSADGGYWYDSGTDNCGTSSTAVLYQSVFVNSDDCTASDPNSLACMEVNLYTSTLKIVPADLDALNLQALAAGINKGAGALNNPCTYALWYGGSALFGAVGLVATGAESAIAVAGWATAGWAATKSAQATVEAVNSYSGAQKGDAAYQTTPKDISQAFSHACLGTTGGH